MDYDAAGAPRNTPTIKETDRWRVRFWSIWTGQALSLVGSALTQFVLLWWITDTTGSVAALSLAGTMALLPQALLGPLGGTLADRLSRRTLILVADSVTALCMVVLIVLFASGAVQLWHVYTLMFVRSSMQAFQSPAAASSTAMLVPPSMLPRVAGLNQALQGVMTVAAAPLGALALAFLPLQGALAIDVVTALLGLVPLLIFRIPQPARAAGVQLSVLQDFRTGLRVVTGNRGLAMLYGLVALVVLTVMPTFTLTPLLVREHFGGGVNQVALMEGFSGLGIIAGGVLITALPPRRGQIAVILVSLAVSCGTVALTALAPANRFGLAILWWVVSGVTFSPGNAPMMALIQTLVPYALQGRVLSLLNTTVGLAGPVGLALGGLLGGVVGVRGVFIVGRFLSAAVCLLGFASSSLRRLGSQLQEGMKEPGAEVALLEQPERVS